MTTGEPDPPGRQTAPVDPLAMAVSGRRVVAGVIAHSVRGSQSASGHFESERRHRMAGSMSSVGECWDHAVFESTFGRMKVELVHHERSATRDEGQASTFEYMEVLLNRVRRHSTLEYKTPDEFERTHTPDSRQTSVHFHVGKLSPHSVRKMMVRISSDECRASFGSRCGQ